jgi:hypothetical protein
MFFRKWRIASLSSLFLFGCETGSSRHTYPDDPLLLDKKPVESKVEAAAPPMLVLLEPVPPAMPSQAVASAAEPLPTHLTGREKQGPGTPSAQRAVSTGQQWVTATPASRAKSLPTTEPEVRIRRQVPETYGHAFDYSWLQGVLAKPSQGPATLRYQTMLVEDKWGGVASLNDDPRLASFRDGDIILIEGELLAQPSDGRLPRFRIHEIWLAHRNP